MAAAIVTESWKNITAIENYQEVAGVLLFRNIFSIAPEAKGLFKFVADIEGEDIYINEDLIRHAKSVVSAVNKAVEMLGEDLDPLVTMLKALGKKHVKYGVVAAHYDVVGQALLATLGAALGDKFTDEVKAAWTEIYGVISSTMIAGAEYPVE
mmetsp:Transcript_11344/g.17009  ORF Transcript_11344/g.17009 Transcript_11344/m.17009 type:complete len:153 (+) Transcript_11344:22-480(+)